MAEELLEFDNSIEDEHGASWIARVLGAERPDGTWVGWIRFRDAGDRLLETERETTQPNRTALVHWARGLTYFYLEGALERGRRSADRDRPRAPRTGDEPSIPAASGPRVKVSSTTDAILEQLMGATPLRAGAIREVPNAGAVVYEGAGDGDAHYLALRFGSHNTGAVLSNWLWSQLRGTGATVHVNGERVELSQHTLSHAIVGE